MAHILQVPLKMQLDRRTCMTLGHSNLLFPLGFPTTPASPFPPAAPGPQFSYSEIDTRALCEDTPAAVGRPPELGNPARRITYLVSVSLTYSTLWQSYVLH